MKKIILIGVAVVLTSCVGMGGTAPEPLEYMVLKKSVSVPSGHSRVHFQNGHEDVAADRFSYHCELQGKRLSQGSVQIKPDKFVIRSVSRRMVSDYLTGMPARFGCNMNDEVYYETHLALQSAKNPGVTKMICREGFSGCAGRFGGKQDIQTALGSKFIVR
jgi:hypothetical protein